MRARVGDAKIAHQNEIWQEKREKFVRAHGVCVTLAHGMCVTLSAVRCSRPPLLRPASPAHCSPHPTHPPRCRICSSSAAVPAIMTHADVLTHLPVGTSRPLLRLCPMFSLCTPRPCRARRSSTPTAPPARACPIALLPLHPPAHRPLDCRRSVCQQLRGEQW